MSLYENMTDLLRRVQQLEKGSPGTAANVPPARQVRYPAELDMVTVPYKTNASADTEDAVTHSLQRVPTGFHVTHIDKGGVIYASSRPWTATKIFLKCSAAGATATLLVH